MGTTPRIHEPDRRVRRVDVIATRLAAQRDVFIVATVDASIPIETEEGKRYRIEGGVSLGDALQIPADPSAPYLKRPYVDEFRTAVIELVAA